MLLIMYHKTDAVPDGEVGKSEHLYIYIYKLSRLAHFAI